MLAIGRLTSFDGKRSMTAYEVRQIDETSGEVEAFPLEAKLAKVYYGVQVYFRKNYWVGSTS